MNNKYCITQNPDKVTVAVEFIKIRKQLFASGERGMISNCQDEPVKAYLAKRKLTFVREIGHALESYQFSMNPDSLEIEDFNGTKELRKVAFDGLTRRFTNSIQNLLTDFYIPNMIDEPDVRELVMAVLSTRLLNGVKLRDDKFDIAKASEARQLNSDDLDRYVVEDNAPEGYMVNFAAENELLIEMSSALISGLAVPANTQETFDRMTPLYIGMTSSPRMVEGEYAPGGIIFAANRYFYVRNNQNLAAAFLNKYSEISQDQMIMNIPKEQFKQAFDAILGGFANILVKPPQKYSLKEVFNVVMNAQTQLQSQDVQSNAALYYVFEALFAPDIQVVNTIIQTLSKKGINILDMIQKINSEEVSAEDKQKIQAKLDETLAAIDPTPFYKQLAIKNPKAVLPSAGGLTTRYDLLMKEFDAKKATFDLNASELEYQKSIVLNLIMGLAN